MLKFVYTLSNGKDGFICADNINEAREKLRKMKVTFYNLHRTFWGKRTYRGTTSVLNIV